MSETTHPVSCDVVLELEEAGVGVEEILQYARGVLSDAEVRLLIDGLETLVAGPGADDDEDGDDDGGDVDGDAIEEREEETPSQLPSQLREFALV